MDKKKTRRKIITTRRLFLVVALFLIPLLAQGAWGMYQTFLRAKREAGVSQKTYESLAERREQMSASLDAVSSRLGMEIELRKRFDVGKPGEELIVVVDRDKPEASVVVDAPSRTWSDMLRNLFSDVWSLW